MPPLAYLLTWTTYGTWLHGDGRGSVDADHNSYGTPVLAPNARRAAHHAARRAATPFSLNAEGRALVTSTIERHCEVRGWALLQLNVRTNHVHVVVAAPVEPEMALSQFKAWCTRGLREAGLVGDAGRVWTEHGSTRYLWDDESVLRARQYTRDGQGPDI